jgi:hypothetical protein
VNIETDAASGGMLGREDPTARAEALRGGAENAVSFSWLRNAVLLAGDSLR